MSKTLAKKLPDHCPTSPTSRLLGNGGDTLGLLRRAGASREGHFVLWGLAILWIAHYLKSAAVLVKRQTTSGRNYSISACC
ncbi:hypothetical protein, partial [Thermosynechococcus sp.]|uniref:hypothetical protein n=1 Tax=Thermosynechococcus sp. TaxID=2814275 RepID=UPI00391AE376